MSAFNGVRVFCATMFQQRQALGDQVTAWIAEARRQRPGFEVVDIVMRQSSDQAFHCVSAILFYKYDDAAKENRRG
jgi:hypothetical protein